ncbi:DUF3566 domain-containing protein [Promicromonospora kroppenstedtii]|uniref:DUF3566 domain-containing protein n=1 Tax=Promicromonospora kroppenstedtii TaxID=440482 RepID=UPI0004AFF58A|nr:DUF3566 domain-containing protein [Promicromonospora kroppenstedtii]
MTSDKNGHVRIATPSLEEDLEITRDRKDVTAASAEAETPDTESAGAGSEKGSASDGSASTEAATGQGKDGEKASEPIVVASPAKTTPAKAEGKPPAPPAPGDPTTDVPTTGGVWRSAYEAGKSGKDQKSAEPTPASNDEDKDPAGLVSAIGRASAKNDASTAQGSTPTEPDAKSWNRVPAPTASVSTPAPAPAGPTDGVKAGAMKAAQAALDAARSAAKKVSSIMPDDDGQTASAQNEPKPRPEMHYTAAGVRGTATPVPDGPQVQQVPAQPASTPTPEVPRPAPAGPRRVRLALSRVDPWSVMKLAFLLAVAVAIMTVVATAVFWSVLNSLGVFTTVQTFVEDAVGPQSNVNLTQFVEFPRVISLATLISICNIVLLTAIATIMAFLYNITAALVGGVHMTLTDD